MAEHARNKKRNDRIYNLHRSGVGNAEITEIINKEFGKITMENVSNVISNRRKADIRTMNHTIERWKELFAKIGVSYETDDEYKEAIFNLVGFFEILVDMDFKQTMSDSYRKESE